MFSKIPQVGITGIYHVLPPFSLQDTEYTCTNISLITDLIKNNVDVYNLYYAPVGLTQNQFNTDVANKVLIVTLTSNNNFITTIPNTYIDLTPTEPTVAYRRIVISLDLGYLPKDVDLSQLALDLNDIVRSRIGVNSNLLINLLPNENLIRKSEYEQNEILRQALITNTQSFYAGLVQAETRIAALQDKVNALETVIINSY